MIIHVNPPQQNPTAEVSGKASAVLGGRREERGGKGRHPPAF